jgi:hypothetical protein
MGRAANWDQIKTALQEQYRKQTKTIEGFSQENQRVDPWTKYQAVTGTSREQFQNQAGKI